MHKLAVFDFDDTLLKGDSFFLFLENFKILNKSFDTPRLALGRKIRFKLGSLVGIFINFLLLPIFARNALKCIILNFYGFRKKVTWDQIFQKYCQNVLVPRFDTEICLRLSQHSLERIIVSASITQYLQYLEENFNVKIIGSPTQVFEPLDMIVAVGRNCAGTQKLKALQMMFKDKDFEVTEFYSDHQRDLPVFIIAKECFCVNPTTILEGYAKQYNWKILKTHASVNS